MHLTRGSVKNPLVLVCNYVFDTLPTDVYQFRGCDAYEGWIATGSNMSHASADEASVDAVKPSMDDSQWSYKKIDRSTPVFQAS